MLVIVDSTLKHFNMFNKVTVRALLSVLGGLSQKTSPPKFLFDILVFNVSLYDGCTINQNKAKKSDYNVKKAAI